MRRFPLVALVACLALVTLPLGACRGLGDLNPFDQDTAGTREDSPRVMATFNVTDAPSHVYGGASNTSEAAAVGAEEGARSGTATPSATSTPTTSPSLVWRLPDGSTVPVGTPPPVPPAGP